MYVVFTNIYHKHQLNVGKYTSPMDGIEQENPLNQTLPCFGFNFGAFSVLPTVVHCGCSILKDPWDG